MQPIDPHQLTSVRGGFGALLQAAGPILNGVASIIGAANGGGGSAAPAQPAPTQAMPTAMPASSSGGGDGVSISVSFNGMAVR